MDAFDRAIALQPDWPDALNDLAWLLATTQRVELRNAARAVVLAEHACQVTGRRRPDMLDTLAAAYAGTGRFAEAVRTAESAIQLARATGHEALVQEVAQRLRLYRASRPYQP